MSNLNFMKKEKINDPLVTKIKFPLFNINEVNLRYDNTISFEECFSFFQVDDIIRIYKYILLEIPIIFFCQQKEYLSNFIEIDPSQTKASLWSGEVQMSNVKIKKELFVDDSTKTISIIFDKIDKPANMKIIDEILLEKKYKEIKEEPLTNDNKKNDKKKKQAKNVQKIELCNYFLITDLMSNKDFSEIFQVKKEKAHYHIKEIKNPKDKEEKDKNNIIKIKNNICTVLYYLRELNIFDFNPISTSLNDTSHIFKELKKFVKSSYYIMNDTIPFEWYANSILESLPKLPDKYKENDYELLFKELKSDIENSLKPLNLDNLNIISDKLKYGKRKKTFYEKADKILKDIT